MWRENRLEKPPSSGGPPGGDAPGGGAPGGQSTPLALGVVKKKITELEISPTVRQASEKMGSVVTDNGNFIWDLKFSQPITDPTKITVEWKMIPGVVEIGLFIEVPCEVHVGTEEGAYILKM